MNMLIEDTILLPRSIVSYNRGSWGFPIATMGGRNSASQHQIHSPFPKYEYGSVL